MQYHSYKYPFITIALCIILGILLGRYLIHYPVSIWLTLIFFLIAIPLFRTPVLNILLFCMLVFAGSLRYHLATSLYPEYHILAQDANRISQFEGIIIDYQYRQDHRNKYLISLELISKADTLYSAAGNIYLYTKKIEKKYDYGDRIQVDTSLELPSGKRNPGQFDYRNYLKSQDIYYIAQVSQPNSIRLVQKKLGNGFIRTIIIPLRKYCQDMFRSVLDEKSAGLVSALILGEKQELDRQVIDNFKNVGVVHVLAISGLHVGFIITFIFSFFTLIRLKTTSKIWCLLVILIIYIILVRFKTPVIRASSMAILYLIGQVLERKTSTYNVIFAAMTFVLLFDPRELFNPGFHFSFMAVLSIIYGYNILDRLLPLNEYFDKYKNHHRWFIYLQKYTWMSFLVSLAAVIGTSPLTLYYYGLFPVYALLANLIVIPLTGIVVFLSLFLLFFSIMSDILARGLGNMILLVNQVLQQIVEFFVHLPFSSIITPIPSLFQMFIFYLLIIVILQIRKQLFLRLMVVMILLLLLLISFRSEIKNDMQVSFLDVGQGDAAFIRFPNQKTMLIDAGNRSFQWDQGEKTVLPYLQSENSLHLDYLVGSHPHNDHIGGFLALVKAISVDTLVLSAYQFNSKFYITLLTLAMQKGIPVKTVMKGDMIVPDSSCRVYVLHPDSAHTRSESFHGAECNNSSVVLKVTYGENSILFTGDLEKSAEQPLFQYKNFLESEIIKIGHHGSSTSTSEELLNYVNPILAIISVAKKNKFKHPSPGTLIRLKKHGIRTYQTKDRGAVIFSISPEKIKKINWK